MFLPVSSIPEEYFYQLLPQGVIDLDKRKLIEAVLGGYQDRVSDLRSYANAISELSTPNAPFPQLAFNVISVKFSGPAGQVITRSLDILPSTPSLDNADELKTWSAEQIKVDQSQIMSAAAGTDLLRLVSVDSVSLLAENVGALLYDGLNDATPEQAMKTRQRLLESWFPRLKIKGTAESYEALGRIIGFESVSVAPLWSRLVPHLPHDPGNPMNDVDFSSRPEQVPADALPDPRYDPLDMTDGPYYDWSSGPLSEDVDSSMYWPVAVNNRNPFVKIAVIGQAARPKIGRYVLDGGASNRKATTLLNSGTTVSNIAVSAIADGATFNGMRVNVVDHGGTAVGLEVSERLSTAKYRSSYFDLRATIATAGTLPTQPSQDLVKTPGLTLDGVAQAPFRPWSGGSIASFVSIFPNVDVTGSTSVVARAQATGSVSQLRVSDFEAASMSMENLDTLRAATRKIRSKGVGLSFRDAAGFATHPGTTLLFSTSGTGTYQGTVSQTYVPALPYSVRLQAYVGSTPQQTFIESSVDGTVATAGDGFSGVYVPSNSRYRVIVTPGQFSSGGKMLALYSAESGTAVRSEPSYVSKQSGTTSRVDRPEDQIDASKYNTSLHDNNQWMRHQVLAGESVDADLHLSDLDEKLTVADTPYKAMALSGRQYEIVVLDGRGHAVVPRYKVLQADELDDATGAPIRNTYDRLLLAQDGTGELHHVLLIDKILVATQYWSPARWSHIAQWTPFNEHADDSITPYSKYAQLVDSEIKHNNRVWDSDFGWVTKFSEGDSCTVYSNVALGSKLAFAFWLKANTLSETGSASKLLTVSDSFFIELRQTVGGDTSAELELSSTASGAKTLVGTLTVDLERWVYIAVRVDGENIDVGYGDGGSITWSNFSTAGAELISQTLKVESDIRAQFVHDLALWSTQKEMADFELMYASEFVPTPVPYPTPYIESLSRDSRYGVRLMQTGFVYPTAGDVISKPYSPAYVQRYTFDALYDGDSRFKHVGIGDGNAPLSAYPLGVRGIHVDGDGRTLVSGSNPSQGYSSQWAPTPGTIQKVVQPFGPTGGTNGTSTLPSTPWPNLVRTNPARDRAYVKGDTGSVYRVFIDDRGAGAALFAEHVMLERPDAEISVLPHVREEPTDFQTVLGTPGKRLSVQVSGTVCTPYEASDAGQTRTTPPLYLYRQTQVVVSAMDPAYALSRWADQNEFGHEVGAPALESNGSMSFANTESMQPGAYQLNVDAGNVGTVDDEFSGFSTVISVIGSGGTALNEFPGIILPSGQGTNPRGITSFTFSLESAISTSWVLRFDWNNDKDVPRKGQKRQLAIYGYELRLVSPALFRVTANPLTLTAVNIGDTSTAQPGGVYAEINSYGTVSAYRNDATVVPSGSSWPLSNLVTSSSWMRRENVQIINPSVEADPAPQDPVTINGVIISPSNQFNIGETALLTADCTGTPTTFVWSFWDGTVEVTTEPQISKLITDGDWINFAVGQAKLEAYTTTGLSAAFNFSIYMNLPPTLRLSADVTNGIFPYVANVEATADDPDFDAVTVSWSENGTHIDDGLSLSYVATKSATVTAIATDTSGGVTTRSISFEGSPHKKPISSPIIRPDIGRISITNEVSFAVYALEANRGGDLTFAWSHWNGSSAGTTTRVTNSNMRFNQISVPVNGQTPGTKTVQVTITDPDGYTTTIQTTIDLVQNVPPIISSVSTPSPGALAGNIVKFSALAVDADNDPPSYVWTFTTPRAVTLYGGNIEYQTEADDAGSVIQGMLVVSDGNGGSTSAETPPVFVSNQYIGRLTVSVVPGFYQAGFNEEITALVEGTTIRYSLDGTDVFKITDGLAYDGSFAFLPPPGGTGTVVLKARAFKLGFAPSDQFAGSYVFYDPNASTATTPDVGTSSTVTLVTVQSDADSLVSTTEPIPGDNQNVDQSPIQAGMTLASIAAEPQRPFTPPVYGYRPTSLNSSTKSFVVIPKPI